MSDKKKRADTLSERYRAILGAAVNEYIRTAEPVSSRAIAMRYSPGVSPATIRGIMAELESEGFLYQPHTSAGRMPTEKGFRFYVDRLLELTEPDEVDKRLLMECCESLYDPGGVFTETTRALSAITRCAGLVFIPGKDNFMIKYIKFLPMDTSSVMVLVVSSFGYVKTRLVRLDTDVSRLDLEKISNYLNSIGRGLTLKTLRSRIVEEMKKEKNLYDRLLANALKLGVLALNNDGEGGGDELYLDGKINILEQPEFRDDIERMRRVFAAFEEKGILVKILDKSMGEDGIHIYMGSENTIEGFEDLSLVTAPCAMEGEVFGTLGVIGPLRMDYSRIVPLVSYTAGLLERLFGHGSS